jgi:ribosomal protein S18 acetylase RimI-like enzyme
MIKIRKFRIEDEKKVINVARDALFGIYNQQPSDLEDLEDIEGNYTEKGGVFYVAEEGDNIVGTIAVKVDGSFPRLKRLYVAQDCRRQGIGKMLLDKIIAFCESKGYNKIVLSTTPEMKDAIRFYKKNGFVETDKAADAIFFERILKK